MRRSSRPDGEGAPSYVPPLPLDGRSPPGAPASVTRRFNFRLLVLGLLAPCALVGEMAGSSAAGPIEDLPAGHWYEVPNARLRNVLPDPPPPGNRTAISGPGAAAPTIPSETRGGPCRETYSDDNPASRHTYGGVQYLPNIDRSWNSGGSLWCGSGGASAGIWTFDFQALRWERRAHFPGYAELEHVSAYGPVSGRVYFANVSAPLFNRRHTSVPSYDTFRRRPDLPSLVTPNRQRSGTSLRSTSGAATTNTTTPRPPDQ